MLWYSLPDCAPAAIDFFRESTVHVEGLGHVCSFGVFDFKRLGGAEVRVNLSLVNRTDNVARLPRLHVASKVMARWRRV